MKAGNPELSSYLKHSDAWFPFPIDFFLIMANPLPANATLVFQVPAEGAAAGLDASGNYVVVTQDLSVQCYLKRATLQRQPTSDMSATDMNIVPLEGYIISVDGLDPLVPQVLPDSVKGGARAQASFVGEWLQSGEFMLQDDIPNPFSTETFGVSIEGILGRKLRGYLNVTVAWGN